MATHEFLGTTGNLMQQIKWEKQGRIITSEDGPEWRRHMSGAVHVMPFKDGRYRVYLTGVGDGIPSALGEPGRRRIGWLDLDHDFNIVHENPANPVLIEGEGGTFDCEGVVMPMIVKLSDEELYMYYAGFGPGTAVWLDNHAGLAISNDGGDTWNRWSRAPIPVRDDSDPFTMGTVWVIREEPDFWRIWYTTASEVLPVGNGPSKKCQWQVFSHLKYATSRDGIHWDKPPNNVLLAPDKSRNERLLTRPMVIREADGYRMWFSLMHTNHEDYPPYQIGYAESPDGLNWERKPPGIGVSEEGWDSKQTEYAIVLKEDDRYLMFYNGNGYGVTGTGLAIGTVE